jgi:hypothetical protein
MHGEMVRVRSGVTNPSANLASCMLAKASARKVAANVGSALVTEASEARKATPAAWVHSEGAATPAAWVHSEGAATPAAWVHSEGAAPCAFAFELALAS